MEFNDESADHGDLAVGDEVIFEYEPGKLIEARIAAVLPGGEFEVRVPPPKSRFAWPLTKRGTFDEATLVRAPRRALRPWGPDPSVPQHPPEDDDDGLAGVLEPRRPNPSGNSGSGDSDAEQ